MPRAAYRLLIGGHLSRERRAWMIVIGVLWIAIGATEVWLGDAWYHIAVFCVGIAFLAVAIAAFALDR